MYWISIFFLIISFLYVPNVFAGPDDFISDFEEARKAINSISVPADKIHLYTLLNNLKKEYFEKARAIYEATLLLENIERTSLNSAVEIERELARITKEINSAKALDAPKGKVLDAAGKLRNEMIHQRLEFLQKQQKILHDAQYGISRAVDAAREEGKNILIALERQLEHQGFIASSVVRRADIFPDQKIQPHYTPPEQPVSDKMRRLLAERAKSGKRNAFPVDLDDGFGGVFPSEKTVSDRISPPTVQSAPAIVSEPGFFKKAGRLGLKGLKALPLVGELWTRKENALMTSAHALTESCIRNESNAGETALYVGMQYVYRGVGFLSLVPNLADSATPESIQSTLNFLLNAGCFDEYREFVNNNAGLFKDLGLNNLQIASPADISTKEKEYIAMQKRLNTPLTDEEIAADRRAANAALMQDLASKRAAFSACCGLITTNTCPLSSITNDLVKNPPILPTSSDKPLFPIPKDEGVPVMTCSGLRADIKSLENRLIVR